MKNIWANNLKKCRLQVTQGLDTASLPVRAAGVKRASTLMLRLPPSTLPHPTPPYPTPSPEWTLPPQGLRLQPPPVPFMPRRLHTTHKSSAPACVRAWRADQHARRPPAALAARALPLCRSRVQRQDSWSLEAGYASQGAAVWCWGKEAGAPCIIDACSRFCSREPAPAPSSLS